MISNERSLMFSRTSETFLPQGLGKMKPSGIISIFGAVRFTEDFGLSDSAMVLVRVKPWNLGVEEDNFFRFYTLFY